MVRHSKTNGMTNVVTNGKHNVQLLILWYQRHHTSGVNSQQSF